jgi:signal transduction histidine kinase
VKFGAWLVRIVRVQDFVWILLFTALAVFGPDRTPVSMSVLLALGIFQAVEQKVPFLNSTAGIVVSFIVKLGLWYVLMGWTDGVSSPYFWVVLLAVISAAASRGVIGLVIGTLVACCAYLSFLKFIPPQYVVLPEEWPQLFLKTASFPIAGYLAYELLEANRVAKQKAEAAAAQLAEVNRDLKKAEATVLRTEKLAALGQLSAGLAHELRNPLGTMKAAAEMLIKSVDGESAIAQEMAGFISSEVDRTNSLVIRFLDFARPLALRFEKTDLAQVLDRTVSAVQKHQPPLDVLIYKNYSPDLPPFMLDGQLMETVLYNLLLNAAQASPPKGSITLKTRQLDDAVEIAVIDRGRGIDPIDMESIFNPFFTTKSDGVGLGLAIVSKIVDEHGGTINVESKPGEGTAFRVYLPLRK